MCKGNWEGTEVYTPISPNDLRFIVKGILISTENATGRFVW